MIQARVAIVDNEQETKKRITMRISGPTMTRRATEILIIWIPTRFSLKGFSITAAKGLAIVKVVRWGHTLKKRINIRRCDAEGIDKLKVTLVHTKKKRKGLGRRVSHSRSANPWWPVAVSTHYLLGKAMFLSLFTGIAAAQPMNK